jgi:Xaa-Pro aminopeptidase
VYLPGVGGVRIEDDLVITPTGPDVLTRTPTDLVVL